MSAIDQLRFSLSDNIDGVDVAPSHVPLDLLTDFGNDVRTLLKGFSDSTKAKVPLVAIESGSLTLSPILPLALAALLLADITKVRETKSLVGLPPAVIKVLEGWEKKSQRHPHRTYGIKGHDGQFLLKIDKETRLIKPKDIWVNVEKYLIGTVYLSGAKDHGRKPLLVVSLPDGRQLEILAKNEQIKAEEANPYQERYRLHVSAKQNISTHEERDFRLIDLKPHVMKFDAAKFDAMVEKGTAAWAHIPDPSLWLEQLRGNIA